MRGQVRHRISAARGVSALAFNPRDDVLMIRTVDGVVHLYDPVTGESIAEWPLPVATQHPLAAWIGDADAMLLGDGDGVYEHRYDQADTLIERGRPYARQRQIVQQIKSGDIVAAWATAAQLSQLDPDLGRWARLNILEIALRRPHVAIPLDWIESVLDDRASAATYIRLGHAAYDGERFDSARRWLQRGRELARDVADAGSPAQDQERIDAFTLWRIAECDYLFGANDQAEAELAAVLRRPDFNPALVPTVALQRVAALALAGRAAEARQAAPRVSEPDAWGRYGDSAAGSSARIIARVMTGLEDETLAAATLDNLLAAVDERSLLYLDDARFYAGELERQRGDLAQAAVQYQQCIDLVRDPWPANWARFRLAQLAQQPQ